MSNFFSKLSFFKREERDKDGVTNVDAQEVDRPWIVWLDSVYQTLRKISFTDGIFKIDSDVNIDGDVEIADDLIVNNSLTINKDSTIWKTGTQTIGGIVYPTLMPTADDNSNLGVLKAELLWVADPTDTVAQIALTNSGITSNVLLSYNIGSRIVTLRSTSHDDLRIRLESGWSNDADGGIRLLSPDADAGTGADNGGHIELFGGDGGTHALFGGDGADINITAGTGGVGGALNGDGGNVNITAGSGDSDGVIGLKSTTLIDSTKSMHFNSTSFGVNSDATDLLFASANGFAFDSKVKITPIGGIAIKLTNKTGGNTIAGQLARSDTATDDGVILTGITDTECIGIFLDSGIGNNTETWIVVAGIADVIFDDNVTAVHGNWVGTGAEAGYARTQASPAAAPQHFDEIGHCIESVTAGGGGTHILARCVLHFN